MSRLLRPGPILAEAKSLNLPRPGQFKIGRQCLVHIRRHRVGCEKDLLVTITYVPGTTRRAVYQTAFALIDKSLR